MSKMISRVYKLSQKVLQNKSNGLFHVKYIWTAEKTGAISNMNLTGGLP